MKKILLSSVALLALLGSGMTLKSVESNAATVVQNGTKSGNQNAAIQDLLSMLCQGKFNTNTFSAHVDKVKQAKTEEELHLVMIGIPGTKAHTLLKEQQKEAIQQVNMWYEEGKISQAEKRDTTNMIYLTVTKDQIDFLLQDLKNGSSALVKDQYAQQLMDLYNDGRIDGAELQENLDKIVNANTVEEMEKIVANVENNNLPLAKQKAGDKIYSLYLENKLSTNEFFNILGELSASKTIQDVNNVVAKYVK